MKEILLVCNAGMSTSLLVTKMKTAAEERGVEAKIWAVSLSEVDENVKENDLDIILVGPQVRFEVDNLNEKYKGQVPVVAINMSDYGMMNGDKILNDTLDFLGE